MPLTFDNELIERFSVHIEKARNIVILSHQNPDGDAVGSALACFHWLRSAFFAGENCPVLQVILPHDCPLDARYLPGSETILSAQRDLKRCEDAIGEADLILGVDFNDANRVMPLDKALSESRAAKLLVDHHHHPNLELFPTTLSVPDLSSTCELLYWLFVQIIGDNSINDDTARCLYHGINTDTGCFAYANEDATLYEATAALMHHPLDAANVHHRLFNSYSIRKMQILAFLLNQKLRIFEQQRFAYFAINADELKRLGGTAEDLEGLVNYTLMMEPIEVGVFVKETDGRVRLSFRAKKDFDVNLFASKYFGGGGHTKASGATSPYNFDETIRVLEENMLNEMNAFLR